MSLPQPISPKPTRAAGDQLLETWKEIAVYLNRDLRTVKRWEQSRGLPVHRLPGGPQAAVYAVKSELDAWRRGDGASVEKTNGVESVGKWTLFRWTTSVAIVLAISGIGLWLFGPAKPKPIPRVTSLTTFPGVEWFPSFSPDGKAIAFSWNGEQENNYDIYVMLLKGGKPLRLSSDPAMDLAPAWSPDGSRIAFLRWRLGESKTERVIIPALGGAERIIDEGSIRPSATGIFFPLMAWTPDGSRLIGGGASSKGAYALRVVSVETGETIKWLTDPPSGSPGDCCPTVSPDGRTLAFLRASPARSYKPVLLDISRDGEPSGELRPLETQCGNPLWSGDSSELLCVVADGEERTLWRIPVKGNRAANPLPSIGALGQHLSISPGGDRLVYSTFSWEDDIWRVAVSGGNPPERLISSTADDLRPQYSPDGKKIAFLSNRSGHLAVWIAEQDGGNPSLLAAAAAPHAPSWSPEGRQIVYTCRVGANTEDICVIGSGGGTPRQLTKDPARDMLPSWSRDGKWIYFASDRSGTFQTWKIASDGLAPAVQVTRNGGFGGIESADGRLLFYGKAILSSPIYRVPIEGGDGVPVGDGVRSLRLPLNFAVNESGIVFSSSDDMTRRFELQRYLFASGKTERIARIERGLGNGISLSPDGRSLLFTTMELRSGNLYNVENFR